MEVSFQSRHEPGSLCRVLITGQAVHRLIGAAALHQEMHARHFHGDQSADVRVTNHFPVNRLTGSEAVAKTVVERSE